MPATYTTSLRLTKPADGDINWGQTVNTGITDLVDASVAGTTTITMTAADYTLSNTNGTTDEARRMFLVATGSPGAPRNVICPAVSKLYFFRNDTAFALTLKTSGGSGISVPAGQYMMLYCDGTNVVDAVNAFGSLTTGALTASSLSLATALAATSGGTGQSVYAVGDLLYASTTTALSKLADVATGNALISGGVGVAPSWGKIGLTTHVSGTLPIASGGTGQTSIAARSIFLANTANTLTTVTPAALQSIRINAGNTAWEAFTPATGDATLSGNNSFTGANTFYNATGQTFGTATAAQDGIILAGRAGGTSTYRVTLSPGTLTASRAITLPNAAGEIVLDSATQTLTNKSLTSPTLTTPALGTPASGVLTNCTGTASGLTAGVALTAQAVSHTSAVNISTPNSDGSATSKNINISTGAQTGATSNTGGSVEISLGGVTGGSGTRTGGDFTITGATFAGNDGQTVIGSAFSVYMGQVEAGAGANVEGGGILLQAGDAQGQTGENSTNVGGNVVLRGGDAGTTGLGTRTGGDIVLETGTGSTSNGRINFINTNVANGTVATTLGSVGPTGAATTVQGWLAIKISGTARYIPFW